MKFGAYTDYESDPEHVVLSSTLVSATMRLPAFEWNAATVHVRGCTGTTVNSQRKYNSNLLHAHLLLVRNETVPIWLWRVRDYACAVYLRFASDVFMFIKELLWRKISV